MPRKGHREHIESSLNVPAASLLEPSSGVLADDVTLAATFARAGVDDARRVITYYGGGVSASLVAFALMKLAHPDIRLYDASFGEWASDAALPMQADSGS